MSKLFFVQKLSHFEVRGFGRISYEKTNKIDILRYFTPNISSPLIFVQISLNFHQITTLYRKKLAEICTRRPHHIGEQSEVGFFENFENRQF